MMSIPLSLCLTLLFDQEIAKEKFIVQSTNFISIFLITFSIQLIQYLLLYIIKSFNNKLFMFFFLIIKVIWIN